MRPPSSLMVSTGVVAYALRKGGANAPKSLGDDDAVSGKTDMVQSLSNAMMRHLQVFSALCLTGF
ncbi:MAG TPA: hypothetical protein VN260_05415 [Dissulfurispiraceae bacterium]|nr:hypothetical protein [Dissulfurispiraceae bacterium]